MGKIENWKIFKSKETSRPKQKRGSFSKSSKKWIIRRRGDCIHDKVRFG